MLRHLTCTPKARWTGGKETTFSFPFRSCSRGEGSAIHGLTQQHEPWGSVKAHVLSSAVQDLQEFGVWSKQREAGRQ